MLVSLAGLLTVVDLFFVHGVSQWEGCPGSVSGPIARSPWILPPQVLLFWVVLNL